MVTTQNCILRAFWKNGTWLRDENQIRASPEDRAKRVWSGMLLNQGTHVAVPQKPKFQNLFFGSICFELQND